MADPTILVASLRDYLVSANLARSPRVSGDAPPCWLEPKRGVPAPGEAKGFKPVEVGVTAVLGLFYETGIASKPYESFFRQDAVSIWIRTDKAWRAKAIDNQLRGALNDKRNWNMAAMPVIESQMWRPLARIDTGPSGYTFNTQYMFQIYQDLWNP